MAENQYVVVIEFPTRKPVVEEHTSGLALRALSDQFAERLEAGKPLRFSGDAAHTLTFPCPGMRIGVFTRAEWQRRQTDARNHQQGRIAVPKLVGV